MLLIAAQCQLCTQLCQRRGLCIDVQYKICIDNLTRSRSHIAEPCCAQAQFGKCVQAFMTQTSAAAPQGFCAQSCLRCIPCG